MEQDAEVVSRACACLTELQLPASPVEPESDADSALAGVCKFRHQLRAEVCDMFAAAAANQLCCHTLANVLCCRTAVLLYWATSAMRSFCCHPSVALEHYRSAALCTGIRLAQNLASTGLCSKQDHVNTTCMEAASAGPGAMLGAGCWWECHGVMQHSSCAALLDGLSSGAQPWRPRSKRQRVHSHHLVVVADHWLK